jgi:hypothetical protein
LELAVLYCGRVGRAGAPKKFLQSNWNYYSPENVFLPLVLFKRVNTFGHFPKDRINLTGKADSLRSQHRNDVATIAFSNFASFFLFL